jgi:hypothetical protein
VVAQVEVLAMDWRGHLEFAGQNYSVVVVAAVAAAKILDGVASSSLQLVEAGLANEPNFLGQSVAWNAGYPRCKYTLEGRHLQR